jgi:3',5'-cyclic AMP phosphodiesterase CpdA
VTSTTAQGETTESQEYAFKTAVEKDTPFSFAVTSETGGYGDDEINRRIFGQMRRYRPDFLLVVGDAVKNGSNYEDWERYLFGPGSELLNNTPFYLCPGNHEENAPWMYKFVAFPEPKNYYSFDYGNVHFVALDSTSFVEYREGEPVRTRELDPGSPQYRFLVNDLEASHATWKIVFFHYPPYVSGDYQVEEMRELCPVLEKYGVDLVFSSHTIVYERSHPLKNNKIDLKTGTIYIVAGGAGAKPDWLHHKRAWHTAQSLAVSHFVQVVVAGDTLELNAIDDDGHPFDRLQLTKRPGLGRSSEDAG